MKCCWDRTLTQKDPGIGCDIIDEADGIDVLGLLCHQLLLYHITNIKSKTHSFILCDLADRWMKNDGISIVTIKDTFIYLK